MSSKRTATIGSSLLWGLATAALLLCVELPASAQTWTVIHSFNGLDGNYPVAGVTRDAAGNLYGTTYGGGGDRMPGDHGTVFKLAHKDTGWVLTPLHHFNAIDGGGPQARVIIGPDGALYGTTSYGGRGYGTVYRLQPPSGTCRSLNCPWTETVLYSFQGGSDGANPGYADLAFDQQGNIYGTTESGGIYGCDESCGVVFKLTRSGGSWSYSVLYSFMGGNDGGDPVGGVVLDASGNLYGTAFYSNGVVYKLTPSGSGWTQSVIYNFPNLSEGASPEAGLIFDRSGNLYGTARYGGEYGAGSAYELSLADGQWNFALLASLPAGDDGSIAALAMDGDGNLYGTTVLGDVFKLTRFGNNWILTELGYAGFQLTCSLVVDSNEVIYGTVVADGSYGEGYVFEIMQ